MGEYPRHSNVEAHTEFAGDAVATLSANSHRGRRENDTTDLTWRSGTTTATQLPRSVGKKGGLTMQEPFLSLSGIVATPFWWRVPPSSGKCLMDHQLVLVISGLVPEVPSSPTAYIEGSEACNQQFTDLGPEAWDVRIHKLRDQLPRS